MTKKDDNSVPAFPQCFVCGTENPHGLKLNFSLQNGKSETTFTGDSVHLGYENVVHGGIISAVLDDAIIWAVYASKKSLGMTAELTVRFLKPVPMSKEFLVQGELIQDKGRLWIGKGYMKDRDGKVYAEASAKIVPLKNSNLTIGQIKKVN